MPPGGPFRTLAAAARRLRARVRGALGPGTRLLTYPDYDTYRAIQQRGNEQKLGRVWAREPNIACIARYAESRMGPVRTVLCHGTRNGAELRWFSTHLSGSPEVLGTDISTTAAGFPNTVVWDFHDLKPEWEGAWDLVYSNSWDHAREPERAFAHWMHSLTDRGLLILEHSRRHEPSAVNTLDPFGATIPGLIRLLTRVGGSQWAVVEVLPMPDGDRHAVIIARSQKSVKL